MFIVYYMVPIFYVFITLIVAASANVHYHTTSNILSTLESYCVDQHLSCQWHDDVLVLDWNPVGTETLDQLWVFNEHARERITAEIALYTVRSLLEHRPQRRVTIVPVLNVWGRKQVDSGRKCLRKNKHGVDTNRNYQIAHRHAYPKHSEEYEGPHALSEPESKLVAALLQKGVQRYINVHSGEFSMYMPYDSSRNPPPHAERMRTFLRTLQPLCPKCAEGSAATVSSYKAYGTSVDYAIRVAHVPEAYTFEVYGAMSYDCETMFNPLGTSEYERIIIMWRKILLRSLQL